MHTRLTLCQGFYYLVEGTQVEPANALIEHACENALELI